MGGILWFEGGAERREPGGDGRNTDVDKVNIESNGSRPPHRIEVILTRKRRLYGEALPLFEILLDFEKNLASRGNRRGIQGICLNGSGEHVGIK